MEYNEERGMIRNLIRGASVLAGIIFGHSIISYINWDGSALGYPEFYFVAVFLILGASTGYILGGFLGRGASEYWRRVEEWVRKVSTSELLLAVVGLTVGLTLSWLLSAPLRMIKPEWLGIVSTILLMFIGGYSGVSVAAWKSEDLSELLSGLTGDFGEHGGTRILLLLDTSAIIDARFLELRRKGFLPGELRVPRFVLGELQTLADSADEVRRLRGRRGLDLLATLSEDEAALVFETDYNDLAGVDDKILRLAEDSRGTIVTTDYNLVRVADVRV